MILSVTFIKEAAKTHLLNTVWLTTAWVSWSCSVTCMLLSFFTSFYAINYAIKQIDKEKTDLNSCANVFTVILNTIGGLSFVIGTAAFLYFAHTNLEDSKMSDNTKSKEQITEVVKTKTKGLTVRVQPPEPEKPKEAAEQK